ncbi:hypothetical protein PDENDC454_04434 [Paenibacillus dendritiformis C454]|uniref:Phage protein Gp138 N-terminal domain-containing protein n=1 Tax=Paenibacillus dendritiformis C454 TaxID=1131935 RepID=H3SBK1_9BACL|nr:Gp138 family membrane-puncturing spike protein [Paenibacillus dendritiformis]EHQ63684.1 hypothetical protein PDENDC454_04434 [Paenibacillus dendritiformis C454]
MAQLDKSLNGWLENALRQLHTATIGRVTSYDKDRRRATIQPLIMQKMMSSAPSPHAVLTDVPVLFQRYEVDGTEKEYVPAIQQGDVVLLVCVERAMDQSLNGAMAYPDSRRRHSLADAVVVGVIT